MKKNSNIRSSFVKESLDKYSQLAASINENTESAVRAMLDEAVHNAYANILKEEDEDYDVDEVEDTEDDTVEVETGAADGADEGMEPDTEAEETEVTDDDVDDTEDEVEDTEEVTDVDTEDDADGDDEEGWSDFSKYEVSDGKYDLSQAEDDEIVKVYKLLKNDDNVIVNKNNDNVEIKDNETGAEYIIQLGNEGEAIADQEPEFDAEDDAADEFEVDDEDFENQENEDMNESKIFELVLNEYNSNVGYTDNYQKKDVMTNPGMKEPGKNVNDWDAGVPKGTEKPFSGKKDDKKTNQPFNDEKGKQIEEEEVVDNNASEETPMEEATNVGGFVQQNSTAKSHVPNSKGRSARNASVAGVKVKNTTDPRYDKGGNDTADDAKVNEGIIRKANKIFKENKELKSALNEFKTVLEEAVVTNVNLGNIIKLLSENSTSNDEKKSIIERFGDNVKTVNESNSLYKMISSELKNREKIAITESKDFSAMPNTQINEKKLYQSPEIQASLEIMNKICKF